VAAKAGGNLLLADKKRTQELNEAVSLVLTPAEPVPKVSHSRNAALVVFAWDAMCWRPGGDIHVCWP
jgi:hypothetical protein